MAQKFMLELVLIQNESNGCAFVVLANELVEANKFLMAKPRPLKTSNAAPLQFALRSPRKFNGQWQRFNDAPTIGSSLLEVIVVTTEHLTTATELLKIQGTHVSQIDIN